MHIAYFDGHCNLCNGFVDFLIRHDKKRVLRYAPLQGKTAAQQLPRELTDHMGAMVFDDDGTQYIGSTAAIRILAQIYPSAKILLILPKFLRDFVYHSIAKNRYKLFGRRETCRLPSAEERALFLD